MQQAIAIDVGYRYTKPLIPSITPSKQLLIPSVVAPFHELSLSDLANESLGHSVHIKQLNGTEKKYFVGDLALREGRGATFTLDRQKHRHSNHDILIFTAARLLKAQPGSTLVVGLPVAYYRSQRKELTEHLMSQHAEVGLNDGSPSRISFGEVIVYPQGAGALHTAPDLPTNGLVLLVDVGYKTTDFIVAEIINGKVKPVSKLCDSIETGVHDVHEAVSAEYQNRTGSPVSGVNVSMIIDNGGKTSYYGKELDMSKELKAIKEDVATSIIDQVKNKIGDRAAFIQKAYLAGGGAEALPTLTKIFPTTKVLANSQWANALGYLEVVRQLKTV
ncbi:MAG: ParM/StbA family protein [Firmicutes bacterium]|nr:ParM/StbA family protein [Bacillota bacterium]